MENVYVYPCSLHPIGRLHINLSLQPSFISIQTISFPICLTIINHMPHDNFVYVVLSSSSFFLLTLELLSPDDPVRPSVRLSAVTSTLYYVRVYSFISTENSNSCFSFKPPTPTSAAVAPESIHVVEE